MVLGQLDISCPHKYIFIAAKGWKQPKCLSTDEWINKVCKTHTMEYYLALKMSTVLIWATT